MLLQSIILYVKPSPKSNYPKMMAPFLHYNINNGFYDLVATFIHAPSMHCPLPINAQTSCNLRRNFVHFSDEKRGEIERWDFIYNFLKLILFFTHYVGTETSKHFQHYVTDHLIPYNRYLRATCSTHIRYLYNQYVANIIEDDIRMTYNQIDHIIIMFWIQCTIISWL